jgi:hypothetical protein
VVAGGRLGRPGRNRLERLARLAVERALPALVVLPTASIEPERDRMMSRCQVSRCEIRRGHWPHRR